VISFLLFCNETDSMDRGRVGYAATGNRVIREVMIKSRRAEHLRRLKNIMTRTPGSSHTIDNAAPVVIEAMLTNPRKVAKKMEFNAFVERENKYAAIQHRFHCL